MAHVATEHVVRWLKVHPRHRTINQGTQIVCPRDNHGFHSAGLPHGARRTHACPICKAHLEQPQQLVSATEKGEYWWPNAA